jgi:hypothetical protein
MRLTAPAAGLVFGLLMLQPNRGLSQWAGTPSELADDALSGALWRIAVATQTRIGFEAIEFVSLGQLKNVPPFPVSSRDEALKAALAANPRYEARTVGDFVVVRPKGAWNDAGNPFNRPVRNLRVENLVGLRDFIYANRSAALPSRVMPVIVEDQSGTVIEMLNQLVQSVDGVLWNATYRPNAQLDQRQRGWDLQLALRDATGMRGVSASCPALPCTPKR